MPVLDAPPGGRQRSEGSGGSTDYQIARATLQINDALEAVSDHYAGQMAAAGWTPLAFVLEDGDAVSVWKQTIEGEPLTATLRITSRGADGFALALMLAGTEP
jgi:hypothetical protein